MIITILKSFMFWKYRCIKIITSDGVRLHGIATKEKINDLLNKKDETK